ncbi:MAG TPA: SGNH/GDSL hydrolase family protein [Sporichthya sp.]|nr:SGNH/GDSL hydrolase family protein [Sporichthya sp.]
MAVLGVGALAVLPLVGAGDDPAAAGGTSVATAPAASVVRSIVGFGDSVPAGTACRCTNFVSVYAKRLPGTALVANYATSGSTSADVLARLAEPRVAARVRQATTVLIMTGANDFADAFYAVSAGADPDTAYAPVAGQVRANLTAAGKRIHRLNPRAHLVVLNYWAAMEDGAVARRDYDAHTRRAAHQATGYLNVALAEAATATGAAYVSTLKAFKGTDGRADPTPLLASDGDHPNATGHRVIAHAIKAVLPRG